MNLKIKNIPGDDTSVKVDSTVVPNDTTNNTDKTTDDIKSPENISNESNNTVDTDKIGSNDNSNTDNNQIDIDGQIYTLNENGDAIDTEGKIIMTKDQINANSDNTNEDESDVSISDLEQLSGIVLTDKEGNKLDFDLSLEGLAKREQAIKNKFLNEGFNVALDNFFKSNPDIYKAYIHKQKTGTLEGFTNKSVYENVTLDNASEDQKMNLVIEAETKAGKSVDEARRYAKFLKVENALDEAASKSLNYLKELDAKEVNAYEEAKKQEKLKAVEYDKKYYGTYFDDNGKEIIVDTPDSIYNKIVTKGQFGNYIIPENGITVKRDGKEVNLSRKQIYDYISAPVTQDGRTKADIELDKLFSNVDFRLRFYMMNLTGNDLSVFVNRELLAQKNKSIKRITTTTSRKPIDVDKNKNKILNLPVK